MLLSSYIRSYDCGTSAVIGATYEQDATESAVGGCTCLHLLSLGLWGRKAEFFADNVGCFVVCQHLSRR